jgi:hypothetical protein
MAKKPLWKRCAFCLEKFIAADTQALDKAFSLHKVNTDTGVQCMGEKQRLMTYQKTDNGWLLK